MPIEVSKLANVRRHADGKITAQCPACKDDGNDNTGNHLVIFASGAYGCAVHPGDKEHRKEIFRLVGTNSKGSNPVQYPNPIPIRSFTPSPPLSICWERRERQCEPVDRMGAGGSALLGSDGDSGHHGRLFPTPIPREYNENNSEWRLYREGREKSRPTRPEHQSADAPGAVENCRPRCPQPESPQIIDLRHVTIPKVRKASLGFVGAGRVPRPIAWSWGQQLQEEESARREGRPLLIPPYDHGSSSHVPQPTPAGAPTTSTGKSMSHVPLERKDLSDPELLKTLPPIQGVSRQDLAYLHEFIPLVLQDASESSWMPIEDLARLSMAAEAILGHRFPERDWSLFLLRAFPSGDVVKLPNCHLRRRVRKSEICDLQASVRSKMFTEYSLHKGPYLGTPFDTKVTTRGYETIANHSSPRSSNQTRGPSPESIAGS